MFKYLIAVFISIVFAASAYAAQVQFINKTNVLQTTQNKEPMTYYCNLKVPFSDVLLTINNKSYKVPVNGSVVVPVAHGEITMDYKFPNSQGNWSTTVSITSGKPIYFITARAKNMSAAPNPVMPGSSGYAAASSGDLSKCKETPIH